MAWIQRDVTSNVLLLTHSSGPLITKTAAVGIATVDIPLFPWGVLPFVRSWRILSRELKKIKSVCEYSFVWTFEGREHSLCAIHRIVRPSLWTNVRLIRVRGQAAPVRDTILNRWIYSRATDSVVFVAHVVRERTNISFPLRNFRSFHYCANFGEGTRPWDVKQVGENLRKCVANERRDNNNDYRWISNAPSIDFSRPVLVVIGRYDSVKGHAELLRAFSQMRVDANLCQLVFIGRSQNVQARSLVESAAGLLSGDVLTDVVGNGTRFFVQSNDGKKRLYVCDEQFADVSLFVKKAHWGVIPSLGSEVICRVAVEFLQNGTPCVAHDVGALAEVLSAGPNLLVPTNNQEILVRKLEEAVDMASNVAGFLKIRESAREFGLRNYSWERFPDLMSWIARDDK
jgi:glycosyltransferase involved in cell wall biosynthesis